MPLDGNNDEWGGGGNAVFEEFKREVAIGNRVLWHIGLAEGITLSLGHVSLRVPDHPDRFIVKGRGYAVDALPAMKADDMIVCDLDGNMIEGPPGGTQCYEVKIHSAIYKNHPDIKSVVHVHPRYTVLMSVLAVKRSCRCARKGRTSLSRSRFQFGATRASLAPTKTAKACRRRLVTHPSRCSSATEPWRQASRSASRSRTSTPLRSRPG